MDRLGTAGVFWHVQDWLGKGGKAGMVGLVVARQVQEGRSGKFWCCKAWMVRQAWRVAARIGLARQAGRGGGVRERRGEGRLGLAGGVG